MGERKLQRTEGNALYNILVCAPLILVALLIGSIVGLWFPETFFAVVGVTIIPLACLYLWLIGAIAKGRWYLEVNEVGLYYRALVLSWRYRWTDIRDVRSERTEGFMGKYDDSLVIETPDKTLTFFLPDFDIRSKKAAVNFIQEVKGKWTNANPSAAKGLAAQPESNGDEDVFDDEY